MHVFFCAKTCCRPPSESYDRCPDAGLSGKLSEKTCELPASERDARPMTAASTRRWCWASHLPATSMGDPRPATSMGDPRATDVCSPTASTEAPDAGSPASNLPAGDGRATPATLKIPDGTTACASSAATSMIGARRALPTGRPPNSDRNNRLACAGRPHTPAIWRSRASLRGASREFSNSGGEVWEDPLPRLARTYDEAAQQLQTSNSLVILHWCRVTPPPRHPGDLDQT